MFTKEEIRDITIVSIILAFSVTIFKGLNEILFALISILLIVFANVSTKKMFAEHFEMDLKTELWKFKSYGYKPTHKFKNHIPAGIIFPLLFAIILIPLKGFTWMASLIFSVKAKPYRAAKRHGYYSYENISENHIAYVAASGIFVNLLLALGGSLAGFPDFAKFNIWFSFFNLIPISNIDGNKIFFGSYLLWSILSIITLATLLGTIIIP